MQIWTFLKREYPIILTIVVAVVVATLGFSKVLEQEKVLATILGILAAMATILMKSRETDSQVQQAVTKILERSQKPAVDEILIPYEKRSEEIEQCLRRAKEVWVLSRTCSRVWGDYYDVLKGKVLSNGGIVRLMLVNPDDGAVKMIADSAEWDRPNDPTLLKQQIERFLSQISGLCTQLRRGDLQVRVLDYLPPWMLVLVDPKSNKGTAYVELATFRANGRNRPTFALTKERDRRLYELFHHEFECMWERAGERAKSKCHNSYRTGTPARSGKG